MDDSIESMFKISASCSFLCRNCQRIYRII